MAVKFDKNDLYRLALVGAAARLEALELERTAILSNFPSLKSGATRAQSDTPVARQEQPRRRRGMSAAARKAVSARMKIYWANRRKSAAKRQDKASR